MKKRSLHVFALILVAAFTGCEDSSSSTAPPAAPEDQLPPTQQTTIRTSSQGAMSPQVAAASTQTVDAFQSLFRQKDSVTAADPMGSQGISIREANAKLLAAWNADKTDSRAAFGAAITGIALKINEMAGTMKRAQDELGLGGETTVSGSGYEIPMATSMVQGMTVLARTVATPAKAPLVHELQDSIEQMFLPTLDQSVQLLEASWSDSAFEFGVAIDPVEFPGDTLVIDRSDVGLALSILQALRAQIRWLVSYNVDIDRNGSYAWAETLSHVEDLTKMSPAQSEALAHFESLFASNSAFLKVRSGKETLLASVPTELKRALDRAREAAVIGYALKAGKRNHLPTIRTTAVRDSFVRKIDSGIALLAGPRDVVIYTRYTCKDSVWGVSTFKYNGQSTTYPYNYAINLEWTNILPAFAYDPCDVRNYDTIGEGIEHHLHSFAIVEHTQTIHVDLVKLISLKDLKVFLPRFQWNAPSTWRTEGSFSLLGGTNQTLTLREFSRVVGTLGFDGVKDAMVWTDPSFGGAFPGFRTSRDVMEYFRRDIENHSMPTIFALLGPLVRF